jgi:hypothetical protein
MDRIMINSLRRAPRERFVTASSGRATNTSNRYGQELVSGGARGDCARGGPESPDCGDDVVTDDNELAGVAANTMLPSEDVAASTAAAAKGHIEIP